MRLHAKIRVDINSKISNSRRRNNGIRPAPEWASCKLMLPASSGSPEQLRLVDIQLKPVGLQPAVNLVNACRQALL